jgi:hypothetical protein
VLFDAVARRVIGWTTLHAEQKSAEPSSRCSCVLVLMLVAWTEDKILLGISKLVVFE